MIERRTVHTGPHGDWHFVVDGEVTINDYTGSRVGHVAMTIGDAFVLAADEGRVVLIPGVGRFLVCREDPFTGEPA